MNFNYDEQIVLALYGETFQKPYGLDDEKNHMIIQSLIYLFKEINIYDYFNFVLENKVFSEELENLLNELEKKKEYIYSFYNNYNLKRLFILLGLFTKEQISKIEVFAYAIRKYNEKGFSIIDLANIAYLKKEGLSIDCYEKSIQEEALELLGTFGIINMNVQKIKLNYKK